MSKEYYQKNGDYSGRYCSHCDAFPNHEADGWLIEFISTHMRCGKYSQLFATKAHEIWEEKNSE